jgi:aspartate dehydrogenase
MIHVAMIGCGAIGAEVLRLVQGDPTIAIDTVLMPLASQDKAREVLDRLAPTARLATRLDVSENRPDVLVECAGHAAIEEHVLPALEAGVPCLVVSIGALSEPRLPERLEMAAIRGNTQVQLLSGAIGGIDALAAAKVGGLDSVVYTGRKAPLAWQGTPAEQVCDLASIREATLIFEGNAQEAAATYPKNANVAATLALAGLGMTATTVRLYADPAATGNTHHVLAEGAFGSMELTMRGKPLAANPKTSALTVYSVVRALRNRAHPVAI